MILQYSYNTLYLSSFLRGKHMPPEDIGSSFYPKLSLYSWRGPSVREVHMKQIAGSVLVLSWYPPGLAEDNREISEDLVSSILDAAYRHNLKVNLRCRSTLSGWNSKQIGQWFQSILFIEPNCNLAE
uniref:Uncharacterized protein n=1 Tax=Takifugu rubripes TaxID=31033 RepID=A0A674NEV9_TAKRU